MKQLKDYILTENNFFKNLGVGQEAQIKKWLDEHKIRNYTINDDLTIDVNGNVNLCYYKEEQLPDYIQFGVVTKRFEVRDSNLTTLQGCPQKVGSSFFCFRCYNLKSLEGAPREVGGHFDCCICPKLESLEGAPQKVGWNFFCHNCGGQFTKNDVKKVSEVKGNIIVI